MVPSWPTRPTDVTWGAVAGIAIGPTEQIWTFNRGPVPVQVYTADGELVRSWGQGQFREPHQVRIDREGYVWLVDSGLHVVQKFTPEGELLLTLGTARRAGRRLDPFESADRRGRSHPGPCIRHRRLRQQSHRPLQRARPIRRHVGKPGLGPGQFSLPHSIALDSRGRFFVADRNNARVQVFDQTGQFLDEWRDLLVPWHIVITERDEIYVCGSSPMRWPRIPIPGLVVGIPPKDQLVMVFTPDGRVTRLCTFPKGQHSGELDWVHALAVDRQGNLYLGDIQGRRAQKFLRLAARRPRARKSPEKHCPSATNRSGERASLDPHVHSITRQKLPLPSTTVVIERSRELLEQLPFIERERQSLSTACSARPQRAQRRAGARSRRW